MSKKQIGTLVSCGLVALTSSIILLLGDPNIKFTLSNLPGIFFLVSGSITIGVGVANLKG